MSGKIICVVTSNDQLGTTGNKTGWYLPEVAHPYKVLTKAGFEVTFVSPKGGKAPMVRDSYKFLDNLPCHKDFPQNTLNFGSEMSKSS